MGIIAAGSIAADYSGWRPSSVQQLVDARVGLVCRYTSIEPNGKNLGVNEDPAEIIAAGVAITPNLEQTQGYMLRPAADVLALAKASAAHLRRVGLPSGVAIPVSHDMAPALADGPVLVRNFGVVEQVYAGELGCSTGRYGGYLLHDILDAAGVAGGCCWQSYGWSTIVGPSNLPEPVATAQALTRAAQLYPEATLEVSPNEPRVVIVHHPSAHVFQQFGRVHIGTDLIPAGAIDENVVMRPFQAWTSSTSTTTQENPMYVVNNEDFNYQGATYAPGHAFFRIMEDGRKRNIDGDELDVAQRAGQLVTPVTSANLNARVDWTPPQQLPAPAPAIDVTALAHQLAALLPSQTVLDPAKFAAAAAPILAGLLPTPQFVIEARRA